MLEQSWVMLIYNGAQVCLHFLFNLCGRFTNYSIWKQTRLANIGWDSVRVFFFVVLLWFSMTLLLWSLSGLFFYYEYLNCVELRPHVRMTIFIFSPPFLKQNIFVISNNNQKISLINSCWYLVSCLIFLNLKLLS